MEDECPPSLFLCDDKWSFVSSRGSSKLNTCFLAESLVKKASHTIVQIDQLEQGDWLASGSDKSTQVMFIRKHTQKLQTLVKLEGRFHDHTFSDIFTSTHRIQCRDGIKNADQIEEKTDEVCVIGDSSQDAVFGLVCGKTIWKARVDVIEVVLCPDVPVENFLEPPFKMLSLGSEKVPARHTRRGGMQRRGNGGRLGPTWANNAGGALDVNAAVALHATTPDVGSVPGTVDYDTHTPPRIPLLLDEILSE